MPKRCLAVLLSLLCASAGAQDDAQAAAAGQLEAMLRCRPGALFATADARRVLEGLGLTDVVEDIQRPAGRPVRVFGDILAGAMLDDSDDGRTLRVFLRGRPARAHAKALGVNQIDRAIDTPTPSYSRETGPRSVLMVIAGGHFYPGTPAALPYTAEIQCAVLK